MLFNSTIFYIFFPIVTFLYFVFPYKYRWLILLCASVYFYMSFIPEYIFILALIILVDYYAGIFIEQAPQKSKKRFLLISLLTNISILCIFKYVNFFPQVIVFLSSLWGTNHTQSGHEILLPIGLSFHTFQGMSYTIEVYRGHQKAERNLGIFALYVMFFPQLMAGPIERPQNLLHQFYKKHKFKLEQLGRGIKLIIWGLFKKAVIADRLAFFVNQVFDNVYNYKGISLVIATVFFAFQIYCDFSGYTDIALGTAELLGFKLMRNFNRPYFAHSISDFWQRWHISLSSWFRDYLYKPLGGNRVSWWRWQFNVLVTFLVSGIWHGSHWTFIVWGILHGIYILVENNFKSPLSKFYKGNDNKSVVQRIIMTSATFILVCFAWIFFRANSLNNAYYIISHLLSGWDEVLHEINNSQFIKNYIFLGQNRIEFVLGILAIVFLLVAEWLQDSTATLLIIVRDKPWIKSFVYTILLFLIFLLGEFKSQQFIYFRF